MARHVLSFSPPPPPPPPTWPVSLLRVALCRGEIRRIKGGENNHSTSFSLRCREGQSFLLLARFFPLRGIIFFVGFLLPLFFLPLNQKPIVASSQAAEAEEEEKRHCGKTEAKMKVSFEGKSHFFGRGVSKSPNVFAMKREKKGHELHPVIRIS